jgi:uncharacterized repeat protein (TIGR01451 family)
MMRKGQNSYMKRTMTMLLVVLAALAPRSASALGTPSGTVVTNTATANYLIGGMPQSALSGSSAFTVDNRVNLLVTRNADASVTPGAANQSLAFSVANLGNAPQRYDLTVVSRLTDSFDMNNVRIYRDDNANNAWDAGDTLYAGPAAFGDVAADGTLRLLVVADTPVGPASGATAVYDLVAATVVSGGTTSVVQTIGPNSAGVDVVFADPAGSAAGDVARDGRHSAAGTFTLSTVTVTMNKTVAVIDQFGGNNPVAGATLRYTVTVTVSGAATANSVVVTDPYPANTTYVAGSLRLNAALLTDAADADVGDAGATTPGAITVNLGSLTAASPVQTIVFDVRIN